MRNLERGVLVGFYLFEFATLLFYYAIALWVAESIPEAEPLLGTVPWPVILAWIELLFTIRIAWVELEILPPFDCMLLLRATL